MIKKSVVLFPIFLFSFVSLCFAETLFSEAERKGDDAWGKKRVFNFQYKDELAAVIQEAIDAYEQALTQAPASGQQAIRFKLIEALYYKGFFIADSDNDKLKIYKRALDLSEESVAAAHAEAGISAAFKSVSPEKLGKKLRPFDDAPRAYFWAAITWGLWGMTNSYFTAGINNVAGKIDWYATVLSEIDAQYADAAGFRILGRLHTVTPKIAFFTDWIDREKGLSYLRKAYDSSDKDVRNLTFLGEALMTLKSDEKDEARELLREACKRRPERAMFLEQRYDIHEGCKLLQKLEAQEG